MSSAETIDVLNRVLTIISRTFPQYLVFARPYVPPGYERVEETVFQIVADQQNLAQRISHLIYDSGASPDTGEFPMEFTDCHDLDIAFLLREAIRYAVRDVEYLKACAESLNLAPAAKSLAEEAVGMASGHLESLQELVDRKASAKSV